MLRSCTHLKHLKLVHAAPLLEGAVDTLRHGATTIDDRADRAPRRAYQPKISIRLYKLQS